MVDVFQIELSHKFFMLSSAVGHPYRGIILLVILIILLVGCILNSVDVQLTRFHFKFCYIHLKNQLILNEIELSRGSLTSTLAMGGRRGI